MNIFLLILSALPGILQLITAVEKMYGEAKQGEVKKVTVMQGVNVALETAYQLGAPITVKEKEEIAQGLSQAVDGTVAVFNAYGWPAQHQPGGDT